MSPDPRTLSGDADAVDETPSRSPSGSRDPRSPSRSRGRRSASPGPPSGPGGPLPAAVALAALLLPLGTLPAGAQQIGPAAGGQEGPAVVDRIVAVVGDTSVLLTEVQQQLLRLRQQGVQIPDDPAGRDSVFQQALEGMIEERMIVEAAKEAGVSVPEQQLNQVVDDRFSQMRGRFPSDSAFRAAVEESGQNMFQFRQMLRDQARAEILQSNFRRQLIQNGELPAATVSEEEIRAYFESRAAGQQTPGSVSFQRVIVVPEPDSAAADSSRKVAEQALEEIRGGTDFAVAARRYSQDPGSREEGGDLGWIRRGDVVPRFADMAWAAPPGRPVGPIRTRFGWHVLQVENVRGGERKIRHILVRPEIDESAVEEARELAASLADSLRDGKDADRLARQYGVPGEQVSFQEVRLDELRGRLGQAYEGALSNVEAGDVVGPFQVDGSFDLPSFVVAEVTDFIPSGEYRLEDVREQIRENLMQQKQFQKYVDRLRDRLHVRILYQ